MSDRRRWIRALAVRLAFLAVGSAVGALLAEGVVRWVAPQQLVLLRPDVWIPDDVLGWRRTANLDTRVNTGERTVRLLTDERGHRVAAGGPMSDPEVRVLALGDSFLEALQVEHEDSVAGLVEAGLTRRLGKVAEVVNTGVAGYGPNHYLIQARAELQRRKYDAVVVFLFLGNDVLSTRLERIPVRTSEERHALRWPRSWDSREVIDAFLYPVNDFLEVRSHLFVFLRARLPFVKERLAAMLRAGKKEVAPDLAVLFADSVINPALDDSPRWALTAEICADVDALARLEGLFTLFVLLPRKSWIDPETLALEVGVMGIDPSATDVGQPFRRMSEELARHGLDVVDTLAAFQAAWQDGERQLFGRVDTHLAPAGHLLVAELALDRLAVLLEASAAGVEEEVADLAHGAVAARP